MVGAGTDPLAGRIEPDERPLTSGERDLDVVGCFEPNLGFEKTQ